MKQSPAESASSIAAVRRELPEPHPDRQREPGNDHPGEHRERDAEQDSASHLERLVVVLAAGRKAFAARHSWLVHPVDGVDGGHVGLLFVSVKRGGAVTTVRSALLVKLAD